MKNNNIIVRNFELNDYENLTTFFKKAYGPNTVFQNVNFLKYYFSSRDNSQRNACLVAEDRVTNQIVSHYGGLFYELVLNGKVLPILWGVNAYTLPEWRGKGLNSQIVDYIHNNNETNAVIGMPYEAPHFYEKLGYQIFNKATLSRYVFVLREKTFEIIKSMPQNIERALSLLKVVSVVINTIGHSNIIKLNANNIDLYTTNFDIYNIATTYRSINFLKWRLINNPYIDYDVFAYVLDNKILAYVALREEILMPHNYKVCRVIDLFGQSEFVNVLLEQTQMESLKKDHIYIDFSAYGELYTKNLLQAQFTRLDNEDYSLLPQVTAPIENRPNHEFIVIQSKKYHEEIKKLNSSNTYFTRIDADRDRISKISQIKGHI